MRFTPSDLRQPDVRFDAVPVGGVFQLHREGPRWMRIVTITEVDGGYLNIVDLHNGECTCLQDRDLVLYYPNATFSVN